MTISSQLSSHILTRRHVAHAGMDAPASALQSQDYLSPAAPQYNFADKETNCESAVATPNNTLSIRDQRSTATHEYSWPIDSQLTNGNWSEGGQSLTVTYCYWERKYQGAKVPSMVLSLHGSESTWERKFHNSQSTWSQSNNVTDRRSTFS